MNAKNLFYVDVTTNKFFPRAKRGERLIMERGISAEKVGKDIVAVGTEENQPVQLAFYQEGMEYFAVAVMFLMSREQPIRTPSDFIRDPIDFKRALKKKGKAMLMHKGITKWCVLYLLNNRENRSPWFYSKDRVKQAFDILTRKYGTGNTIIYMD